MFKAKNEKNEWVEGSLIDYSRDHKEIVTFYDGGEGDLIEGHVKIKPQTVCQYVGILDSEGKAIYTGDILEIECKAGEVENGVEMTYNVIKKIKGKKQIFVDDVDEEEVRKEEEERNKTVHIRRHVIYLSKLTKYRLFDCKFDLSEENIKKYKMRVVGNIMDATYKTEEEKKVEEEKKKQKN